jgi:hypothetical protein
MRVSSLEGREEVMRIWAEERRENWAPKHETPPGGGEGEKEGAGRSSREEQGDHHSSRYRRFWRKVKGRRTGSLENDSLSRKQSVLALTSMESIPGGQTSTGKGRSLLEGEVLGDPNEPVVREDLVLSEHTVLLASQSGSEVSVLIYHIRKGD